MSRYLSEGDYTALRQAARTLMAVDVLLGDCRCGHWCSHMAAARQLVRERVTAQRMFPPALMDGQQRAVDVA
jgi:hypothetical protein